MDGEETINFLPELADAGTPKSRIQLYTTAAYIPFVILDPGPLRGILIENGRAFAVSGAYFYEWYANQTCVVRGIVAADSKPAAICSNGLVGFQLFITSGGKGYIFDLRTNVFTEITDDAFPFPALWGVYINGWFIVLSDDRFQLSELGDGLAWDGLDTAQTSQTSDLKVAMRASHTELWLWGTLRTEVWSLVDASFPLAPNPSAPIDHGIAAPASAVILDNTVFWVAQDENGKGIVVRAHGYTPSRISTFALENQLSKVRLSDVIGFSYSQGGHLFYALYIPGLDKHWVFDIATNLWFNIAVWNEELMRWRPHVGRCAAFGFGRNFVGDRLSGTIYELRLDQYADRLVVAP